MQQSGAFKSEDLHLPKSFKVIALKNKAHLTIIIIGDVLNTEFGTSDKRHFGAQTVVSNMENLAFPDWSIHGE